MQDVGVRERLTGEVVKMYSPPTGGTVIYIEFRWNRMVNLLFLTSRIPPEDSFVRRERVRFWVGWQYHRTARGRWCWDQVATAVVCA